MPQSDNRKSGVSAEESLQALGAALRRVHGLVGQGNFEDLLSAIDDAEAAARHAKQNRATPDGPA